MRNGWIQGVLALAILGGSTLMVRGEGEKVSALPAAITAPAIVVRPQTEAEKKGIDFLLTKQDKTTGAWLPQVGPAVTAMVVKGLINGGKAVDDPAIVKALEFIETCHQKDGGYYKDSNPNYNSAVVLSMFAAIPGDKYKTQIKGLQEFLKSLQQLEGKTDNKGVKITKDHPWYGGAGYGEDRPDLSNTSYFIEALHDSGAPADDPAIQKALIFVTRSQMLGETNDQAFAKSATDGGFIYTPAAGGESKFGDIDKLEGDSQLRSYGSMTYAGFKSLLYAGLTDKDPRVSAAVKWIQNNWTLEFNPGSSSFDGQYYFYHAFARAMHAYGKDTIIDAKNVKHDWRKELNDALAASQAADGSWVNPKSPRWFEGNPILVTAYGILCLEEARK